MKFIITTIILLINLIAVSQNGFVWERIDSVSKSKDKIYSDTKSFIAKTWKSANDVIQNDDKEGGIIILKGLTRRYNTTYAMNLHEFTYQYTMTFSFKEQKYRVQIQDVNCFSHYVGATKWPCIQPIENATEKQEGMKPEKINLMMSELKDDLQKLVNFYENEIKSESGINGDW